MELSGKTTTTSKGILVSPTPQNKDPMTIIGSLFGPHFGVGVTKIPLIIAQPSGLRIWRSPGFESIRPKPQIVMELPVARFGYIVHGGDPLLGGLGGLSQ